MLFAVKAKLADCFSMESSYQPDNKRSAAGRLLAHVAGQKLPVRKPSRGRHLMGSSKHFPRSATECRALSSAGPRAFFKEGKKSLHEERNGSESLNTGLSGFSA